MVPVGWVLATSPRGMVLAGVWLAAGAEPDLVPVRVRAFALAVVEVFRAGDVHSRLAPGGGELVGVIDVKI
jgi:hypothetical protein